ncbi:DNA mismatch repair endonuclease MutL [Sodaliphilus sp.]|uniref:DNA mismatch repair endonuclease MutL n=1 Tax=Sodaliphilus sp. TaxID=2815818 RepID=UPI00388F6240
MSDVIKLLPDSVANQIAAGEVIQRPASVIKELVENAIDAHATNIQIILKDAGRTLIQIIDNGCGMSDTDARLAFERHSTSKIRSAEDLFSLRTMGFRGEALASIAAIAQLELRTRRAEDELGTKIVINGSKCESQEPDMCPKGSNFQIKNLFYNVPARRKFLKSNQVELSNIIKEFEKLALVNNNVDFTLLHNGAVMYKLQGGSFLQRITNLLGRSIEGNLIPVNIDTSIVKISGYIGKPSAARKRNYLQYLFVNERYMRHPYFHKAILSSYSQLIPDDEQPNYFLRFDVDPESIDVNIHPTKTEIKFENEMPIWQILSAGVKEALGRFSETPSIEFDVEDAPEIPAYTPNTSVARPEINVDKSYNPFVQGSRSQHAVTTNWDELYKNFEKKKSSALQDITDNSSIDIPELPVDDDTNVRNVFDNEVHQQSVYIQLKGKYILASITSGLMIIDQHRAHVRVLFDQYMSKMEGTSLSSQTVLFPEVLHLTNSQNVVLNEIMPDLELMGFTLASLGGNDWSINSIPAGFDTLSHVTDTLIQVIDSVENGGESIKTKVHEHIALNVARSAALPYGRTLNQEEMDKLVADLLRLPEPNYTPDGKNVINTITFEQISKLF